DRRMLLAGASGFGDDPERTTRESRGESVFDLAGGGDSTASMDRNAPSMISFAATTVTLPASAFVPLAVGFFGLGTGYLIYGPEELFGLPQRSRSVDLTTGLWGIWMPGFMQFLTGVYLWVGLLWFHSFRAPTLYMAA